MSTGILPTIQITGLSSVTGLRAKLPTETAGGSTGFDAAFRDAVSKVESFQVNAKESVNRFLSGEGEEIHKVALAAQQADLSFQLFLQARNKIVSAYQEVMRMQL
ncbi:MAG: flagellar hook-basal body complex protein FliE [Bryobacteraceae bacterium]